MAVIAAGQPVRLVPCSIVATRRPTDDATMKHRESRSSQNAKGALALPQKNALAREAAARPVGPPAGPYKINPALFRNRWAHASAARLPSASRPTISVHRDTHVHSTACAASLTRVHVIALAPTQMSASFSQAICCGTYSYCAGSRGNQPVNNLSCESVDRPANAS